jgi:cell wall-associated NlpC family hydrolase
MLPRDTSIQGTKGTIIAYKDKKPGDLAFFENSNGKLTHVGIIGTEDQIIHAAGFVKTDLLTEEGIWNEKYRRLTHNLSQIRRVL